MELLLGTPRPVTMATPGGRRRRGRAGQGRGREGREGAERPPISCEIYDCRLRWMTLLMPYGDHLFLSVMVYELLRFYSKLFRLCVFLVFYFIALGFYAPCIRRELGRAHRMCLPLISLIRRPLYGNCGTGK